MKLVHILPPNCSTDNSDLYSIIHKNEKKNEFRNAFDNWNNPEYLLDFFTKEENKNDLLNGYFNFRSIEDAILQTREDSFKFEGKLLQASKEKNLYTLSNLFLPLGRNDIRHECDFQKNKTKENWLRIYSVKILPTSFVISGSAIKLTLKMEEREHTRTELHKLNKTVNYLKENCCYDSSDLKNLI